LRWTWKGRAHFISKVKSVRVTMRDIAERCGLSTAAVSLALRNHGSIPASTCSRVRSVSEAMGYRPDPALAALNFYRHQRQANTRGNVLAYVTGFESPNGWDESPFFRRAYFGARDQAKSLGYRLEHAWLGEPGLSPERFAEVLEHRGIRGMIIAPLPKPASKLTLPWERFSSVAIGPSLVDPELHSSCGNQYQAMLLALERLRLLGYRRIGLLLDPDADRRHQRKYQAALAIFGTGLTTRPLIANHLSDREVRSWLRTQRPDVVVSHEESIFDRLVQLGISIPGKIGFASVVRSGRAEISGIETFPEQIAAAAVVRLQQMLHENETGVPEFPVCIMLPGKWVNGATTRMVQRREPPSLSGDRSASPTKSRA
jgi:LacI family transcriptional regulator